MISNKERIERISKALDQANLDALVCALPTNVLLLSGYWSVVGTAVAIALRDGSVQILAPEDEEDLARHGWADEVHTFSPGSLTKLQSVSDAAREPLKEIANRLHLRWNNSIGYESGGNVEPASYAAMYLYGAKLYRLLSEAFPVATLRPTDALLLRLRSVLTPFEQECVRVACRIAAQAYQSGTRNLRPGLQETEAAVYFRVPLSVLGTSAEGIGRADGFVFCMSGENSAEAYAAYQRSRARVLKQGDLVLVHCNSYADGYWTDITRTFCFAEMDERKRRMYEAIFAARQAALEMIRPGVKAAAVDKAAREVMTAHGFGKEFRHGLGHGVGFAAINHNAPPRLHPASNDVLETGMIFNIEPAIYFTGYGGMRHCDMVAVTEDGAELLTPFLSRIKELVLP
jgi:Xaa-Pro aminopeptidase